MTRTAQHARITVADIMSPEPTTLRAADSLSRAAEELRLGEIRHLPITDDDNHLVGLLTQRDLLAAGRDLSRPIGDVMQTDIKTVAPETPAHEAAYLLLHYAIGCTPVTDDHDVLLGIVTDTDFVRVAYKLLGGEVDVDQLELEAREADEV